MGVVYKARDLALDRIVAIKIFRTEATAAEERQEFFTRLSRQVRSAAKLTHLNIVATYRLSTRDDRAYLVMEYVDGQSLMARIGDTGIPVREALDFIRQIASALDYAHSQGVVHGDLKPANILLRNDGVVKIADFELMRATASLRGAQLGTAIGTPYYLSPEQIEGHPASPRSDQHSLAVCAFEMFCGQRPFSGETIFSLLESVLGRQPADVTALNPTLGPAVQNVLERALAKNPEERFESCLEFASQLEGACGMTPSWLPRAHTGDAPRSPEPPVVQPLDDDVQFTVYRPDSVQPLQWRPLLAFAHRSQRPPDEPDEPDPVAEVKRQAEAILGDQFRQYDEFKQESAQSVQRGDEITFVPQVDGVEFDPPRRSFKWRRSVHREEFQLRAEPRLEGQVARGRLSVYLGNIIVGQVTLRIEVAAKAPIPARRPMIKETARIYCNIFVSYSHRDAAVVQEFQRYAAARGDKYLMDVANLNPGEPWGPGLRALIDEAHVFQLFWSRNSMRSEVVREEYQYALTLPRERFVCPVYWEDPMPQEPERGLPPDELRRLHFQRIYPAAVAVAAAPKPPVFSMPAPASRPQTIPQFEPSVGKHSPTAAILMGVLLAIVLCVLLYWFVAKR